MKQITRVARTAVVALIFLLGNAQESLNASQLRSLLMAESFKVSGMQKIFATGSSSTGKLLDALNDSDQAINLNAQLMLRLIGDVQGVKGLHEWYERPRSVLRTVNGPFPVPLRDWDYKQIDAILSRPSTEWKEDAINYLYALAIDSSPQAREMLTKMLNSIANDRNSVAFQAAANLRRSLSKASACTSGNLKSFLRVNSFFLTQEESKAASINIIAFANDRHLVLAEFSQTFGNTFIVVMKRTGQCWRYQAVAL